MDNIKSKTYEKDNILKSKTLNKEQNISIKNVVERITNIIKIGQEYKQKYKSSLGSIVVVPKLGACGIGQCLVSGYSIDTDNNYIYFLDRDKLYSFLENKENFISIEAPSRTMYFEKELLLKDYLSRFEKLMILQKSSVTNSETLVKKIAFDLYYEFIRNIIIFLFCIFSVVVFILYSIYASNKITHMKNILKLSKEKELLKQENNNEQEQLIIEKNKFQQAKELFSKEKSQFEKFQAKQSEREKALDNLQTELYHDITTNTRKVIELSTVALLLISKNENEKAINLIQRIHDLEDCKNKGMSINKRLIEHSSFGTKGTITVYFPYDFIQESFIKNLLGNTSPLLQHNIQEWIETLKTYREQWEFFKIENYIENDLSRIMYKLLSNAYKHNSFDFMPKIRLNFLLLNNYFEIRVSNYLVNSSVTEASIQKAFYTHGNLAAAYKLAIEYNLELNVEIEKEKNEIHFLIKGKNSNG